MIDYLYIIMDGIGTSLFFFNPPARPSLTSPYDQDDDDFKKDEML